MRSRSVSGRQFACGAALATTGKTEEQQATEWEKVRREEQKWASFAHNTGFEEAAEPLRALVLADSRGVSLMSRI